MFLFTADWHISKDKRLNDTISKMQEVCNIAINTKVEVVFILGDIYDKWQPSLRERKELYISLEKLFVNNIDVVILVGNHDYRESNGFNFNSMLEYSYFKINKLHVFSTPGVWEYKNNVFFIMPHLSSDVINNYKQPYENVYTLILDNMISQYKGSATNKFILSHLLLKESGFVDPSSARAVSKDVFLKYKDIPVLLGDIHKPMEFPPNIKYVGSIDRLNFNELSDKKRVLLYKNNSFESIPLKSTKYVDIKIDLIGNILNIADEDGVNSINIPVDPADSNKLQEIIYTILNSLKYLIQDSIVRVTILIKERNIATINKGDIVNLIITFKPKFLNLVKFETDKLVDTNNYSKFKTNLDFDNILMEWCKLNKYTVDFSEKFTKEVYKCLK